MENKVKFEISTSSIVKLAAAVLLVWFLFAVREIVVLLFIVLIIVAALIPVVNRMAKHIPRVLAVILLALIFLAILTGIGFILVPPVITQLRQLAINLPLIFSKLGPFYQSLQHSISNYQESLLNLSSGLGRMGSSLYSTTIGFISAVVAIGTIIVLTFYMLIEQDAIKNFISQVVAFEHKERLATILKKIAEKMGGWLRGQFILMLAVGILDGIALLILGIPYALVLAVWGGLTEVIPYIGPWLGLIPALIIAFTVSPLKALLILIIYVLIQQLESQFLVPKIMGRVLGLSPVIIILAILVGAKLMGMLGVVIAVPVAAAISVLIQEWPEIKKIRP